mmetsp:Transcript_26372/g.68102  ORF Transcript_26372/g.68102 Transcript_26372/m.68102 type:complete len:355 (+) Transcript_26372:72-1136(+)
MSGVGGLALFASIMAPASFFLGFAVATAGFTCWNLVMPLLFNWLGFELFDALFLSVAMDTVSSLVLVIVYLEHGKVDKTFVLYFGGIAATAAAVSSRMSDAFLKAHTSVLRGSVGYVPLFFGVVFTMRALREWRQRRGPHEAGAALRDHSHAVEDAVGHEGASKALVHRNSSYESSTSSSPGITDRLVSEIVYGPGGKATPGVSRGARISATAVLLGILGTVCGIVGSGGGVMYVSVIILVWAVDDLPLATGTGVALMCFQCAALLADFVDKPQVLRREMVEYCAVVLPCCMAGAVAASQALLCMSKFAVNLTVAFVSFALGAVITLTSLSPASTSPVAEAMAASYTRAAVSAP